MKTVHVEALAWVLIYAGALALCVAIFIAREGGAAPARWLGGLGALAAVVGAALIYLRSRMPNPHDSEGASAP